MFARFFVFFLFVPFCCFCKYFSQGSQDKIANERYFKDKLDGIFVDIGANNGLDINNTYFFEKNLNWQGICIEPIPEVFQVLQRNRSCYCIPGCVTDFTGPGDFLRVRGYSEMLSGLLQKYDPRHLDRVKREIERFGGSYELLKVNCYLLNDLLEMYGYTHIDFLSIDTEGGEFDIISTIDYSKYTFDVITLEDNYDDTRFVPFLKAKGYLFIERIGCDLLFVRKEFLDRL